MNGLCHPIVRDLAWVVGAPGLLQAGTTGSGGVEGAIISDAESAGLLAAHASRLAELDQDPAELLAWLGAHDDSKLLGRYFEALIGFWIARVLKARRLEPSVKVLRDKQVVGEMDFVFEDSRGGLRHWETSVKFYLCTSAEPEGARRADSFLGTMTRDRLDKKIHKLFDKQLGIPHTPEGREALRGAGFDPEALAPSRLLMKGALFYPVAGDWRAWPHPPEVSPRHQRGWWSAELPEGDAWVILDRRRWLSPFRAEASFEPLARAAMLERIREHFAGHRTAFMVASVERASGSGVEGRGAWVEVHRGLVVHSGWPWPVR